MNRLDLFLIALALLVAWTGYRRGAIRQVLSWGGLVLGIVGGAALAPQLAPMSDSPFSQVLITSAGMAVGGLVGNILGRLLGRLTGSAAKGAHLGKVDSVVGVAIAVGALAIIVWFLAYNLVNGPFPGVAQEIQGSGVVKGLDATLPEPPALFSQVRDLFSEFDFPQVFSGLPPAPAEAVGTPTQEEAAQAYTLASGGTLRVLSEACDQLQEGSGFAFAPNYVMTNAHVVAGSDSVTVETDASSSDGRVVLFDPALDVAVIRVAETPEATLSMSGEEVERGAGGAVIGYPGGGELAGVKAAVTRVINADGRDIYGRKPVTRRVYELQTKVVPGNSGGPFVLLDGSVAGMVFAASSTDEGVGYAITSTQLEDDIGLAVTRVSAVGTGRCVP